MGEGPGIFLVLVVGIVLADVRRAVADDSSGVQPVVRPYRHRHQAEGGERPHGGEEDLDPLLTHHAFIRRMEEEKRKTFGVKIRVYRSRKQSGVEVMMTTRGRIAGGGEREAKRGGESEDGDVAWEVEE